MPIEAAIQEVSAAFVPDGFDFSEAGGRPQLIKLDSARGWARVRRWPAETSRQRVEFVASVRTALADAKLATAPRPIPVHGTADLFIERNGRLFEAQEWRDGRPSLRKPEPLDLRDRAIHAPANLPDGGLPQVAATLAEHHLATAALVAASAPAAPLRSVLDAVARQWSDDHALVRGQAMSQTLLQRWIRASEQAFPAIEHALTAVDFLSQSPSVVARFNVWPAHLLFATVEGADKLTTLLDPSAAAVSSPLIDIAQAITHGSGWTTAAAEIGLAAYGEIRRLTPDERRLLPAVAALDLVAESGRLFRIAFASRQDVDWRMVDFARNGGTAALISLETVLPAIRRATETGPLFKARPWIRRPRPSSSRSDRPTSPRGPKPKR